MLARLYWQFVKWAITAGALAGVASGAYVGFVSGDNFGDGTIGARIAQAFIMGVVGLMVGTILAAIPAIFGGFAVTTLIRWRHLESLSPAPLERDLGVLFGVGLAVINLGALALLGSLDGWSKIWPEIPVVLLSDACVILMLWRAKSSIVEEWSAGLTR